MIFGDEMLAVRDVGLFEHTILVLANEVIRDVLLKGQLRGFFLLRHGQFVGASSRVLASRTASWSLRSSSFLGNSSVQ